MKPYSLFISLFLAGCATVGPNYRAPTPSAAGIPAGWHARLPHGGNVTELERWWQQFNDPVMTGLIEAAEAGNPTVDQAVARIRQARATLGVSKAAQLPAVNGAASTTRSNNAFGAAGSGAATAGMSPAGSIGTMMTSTAGLDASWEIDLFGGARRSVQGSQARLGASVADWHDARVSLGAEVANAYASRRQCEALVSLYQDELTSRKQTQRLTHLKVGAGFAPPADAAQADGSVATAADTLESQKGVCGQDLNALVALTGLSYPDVEARLAPHRGQIPEPRIASIPSIPAVTLSQRPDISSAERSLAAASADIGVAIANRLPSLSLAGNIGINSYRAGGASINAGSWSFGPSLSLPVFDGGSGAAKVESARGKYDEALASYKAKVRQAVQNVEDALVRVDTVAKREQQSRQAVNRYNAYLAASASKYKLGAGTLLELEDARRTSLASKQTLAAVELERAQSWIALYKAVGGGWQGYGLNAPPSRQ